MSIFRDINTREFFDEAGQSNDNFKDGDQLMLSKAKMWQRLAQWMAGKLQLRNVDKNHYIHFIYDCCKQIKNDNILVDMAYLEIKRHSDLENISPVSKDEIRSILLMS